MLRPVAIVALAVGLAGCAVSQQSAPVAITEPTPICTNARQCEAMWASAPSAIEAVTGMRVRSQSDSMIDTFAPSTRQPRMFGRVTKRPVQSGGYAIEADLQCHSAGVCDRLRNSGMNLFNRMVINAGLPFVSK